MNIRKNNDTNFHVIPDPAVNKEKMDNKRNNHTDFHVIPDPAGNKIRWISRGTITPTFTSSQTQQATR
jgi:hypothetical protein